MSPVDSIIYLFISLHFIYLYMFDVAHQCAFDCDDDDDVVVMVMMRLVMNKTPTIFKCLLC